MGFYGLERGGQRPKLTPGGGHAHSRLTSALALESRIAKFAGAFLAIRAAADVLTAGFEQFIDHHGTYTLRYNGNWKHDQSHSLTETGCWRAGIPSCLIASRRAALEVVLK